MEMTTLTLLLLVPLAVWRIYSRLKKMMVRTQSELWRHYTMAGVMSVALLVMLGLLVGKWIALGALIAGAAVGVALGYRNLRLTRLENKPDGFFYTPDRRIPLLVTMLFISRLIYRLFEAYLHMHDGLALDPDFLGNPVTSVLVGLLAGYYATYSLLLVRWHKSQKPLPRPINIFDIK
jgi:ABC-type amino acid transport system permease subunit